MRIPQIGSSCSKHSLLFYFGGGAIAREASEDSRWAHAVSESLTCSWTCVVQLGRITTAMCEHSKTNCSLWLFHRLTCTLSLMKWRKKKGLCISCNIKLIEIMPGTAVRFSVCRLAQNSVHTEVFLFKSYYPADSPGINNNSMCSATTTLCICIV